MYRSQLQKRSDSSYEHVWHVHQLYSRYIVRDCHGYEYRLSEESRQLVLFGVAQVSPVVFSSSLTRIIIDIRIRSSQFRRISVGTNCVLLAKTGFLIFPYCQRKSGIETRESYAWFFWQGICELRFYAGLSDIFWVLIDCSFFGKGTCAKDERQRTKEEGRQNERDRSWWIW